MELSQRKCKTCKEEFFPVVRSDLECISCWRKSMNKKEFHFGG